MPNTRDPFEMDDGIENVPVVQAPVKSINKVATTGTKYVAKQAKAMTKAFISQLYGSSGTTSPTATDDDQQQADATAADPLAQIKKVQGATAANVMGSVKQHGGTSGTTKPTASTPEEEEELAATRRALHQHLNEYQYPTFGKIDDVEGDVKKEAQKRAQEDQQKKQQEEEDKQEKAKKAQENQQALAMPRGRVRGQPPGVLKRSQTKMENKTGYSG